MPMLPENLCPRQIREAVEEEKAPQMVYRSEHRAVLLLGRHCLVAWVAPSGQSR